MTSKTHTTLLLDADILAFQLSATAQRGYQFPGMEEKSIAVDDWEDQPERIDDVVARLCSELGSPNIIICLSCPTEENFRLDFLPSYKGNRDYTQRPAYLSQVKQYLEDNYPSYRRPRLEADDIMGILSTHPTIVPGKRIIVSNDKDMKTIPGWLFNPNKDSKARLVDCLEADRFHAYQTLIGDSVDGYKGLPGIGPKKAEKILDAALDGGTPWANRQQLQALYWQHIVAAYKARGLTEEDALVQARAARILQHTDYDYAKKEPILWTPPRL